MHPHEHGLLKAMYSVNETLSVLSIGRTSLYELVKRGELRPAKLGKKTLFYACDLAVFLDRLRAASASMSRVVTNPPGRPGKAP
jgi:excisionase family DNA binding protein